MSAAQPGGIEVAILARVFNSEDGRLSEDQARLLLSLQLSEQDQSRMHDLAVRNQSDDLSASEREEMIAFGKATTLLSILKARSRRALGVKLDPSGTP